MADRFTPQSKDTSPSLANSATSTPSPASQAFYSLSDCFFGYNLRALVLGSALLVSGNGEGDPGPRMYNTPLPVGSTFVSTETGTDVEVLREQAVKTAEKLMLSIRNQRLKLGYPIDHTLDVQQTGLLGLEKSPITSIPGTLELKQSSLDTQWAAVFTQILLDNDLKSGDHIAVCCTGSLPAANINFLASCEALGLNVTVIHSAASSQWGANLPGLTWPEMERMIREEQKLSFDTVAYSLGGSADMAKNVDKPHILENAITGQQVEVIKSSNLKESIDKRMQIFSNNAPADGYKLFVNIGGGRSSCGGTRKDALPTGLHSPEDSNDSDYDGPDCVGKRMLEQGIPFLNIRKLDLLVEQEKEYQVLLSANTSNFK